MALFWLSDKAWVTIKPHLTSHHGFWLKLIDALVDAGVGTKSTAIDSTYIKAQRAAFCQKDAIPGLLVARAVARRPRSMSSPMSLAVLMR